MLGCRQKYNFRPEIFVHCFWCFLGGFGIGESTDTQFVYKQPINQYYKSQQCLHMSSHKVLLMIALFAVAQMLYLPLRTHDMIEMHGSRLNVKTGHFPQKVRIIDNNSDPNKPYGLYPNENGLSLQQIKKVNHNETDKSIWTMIKNADGSFSFQSYDGRKMKCPNTPANSPLILAFPGISINQKFSVDLAGSSGDTYIIRCKEGPFYPALTPTKFSRKIQLSSILSNSNVWFFST